MNTGSHPLPFALEHHEKASTAVLLSSPGAFGRLLSRTLAAKGRRQGYLIEQNLRPELLCSMHVLVLCSVQCSVLVTCESPSPLRTTPPAEITDRHTGAHQLLIHRAKLTYKITRAHHAGSSSQPFDVVL